MKDLSEQLELIIEESLNNEVDFLTHYRGPFSGIINRKLRERTVKDKDKILIVKKGINEALSKLAPFNNKIVYRTESPIQGFNFSANWFSRNINTVICYPSFLSCSKAFEWMRNNPLIFEIKTNENSNAYDLQENKPEQEVIFKSGTCFEIIDLNVEERRIFLQETKKTAIKTIFFGEEYHEFPYG